MKVTSAAAFLVCVAAVTAGHADPPELSSWLLNQTGVTGYAGLPADVQTIRYSAANVYVNCSGIPDYAIGPWPGNPNTPSNQGYLLRIPRLPAVNTGTKTATPLGAIGVWVNGVPVYNPLDANSYNNQNVWHQNAVVVEGPSFDSCFGHPAPGGRYHHHQNPRCLYTAHASEHSPIVGYAFDGYPIYGPYGYRNADGTGGITRLRTGYQLRNIVHRTTYADGTVVTAGPDVSAQYPLGYYVEDFEYVSGLGDLDAYNGRLTVTPDYPLGTYAYFVTLDGTGASAYPYCLGPYYYGVVAQNNITSMGHVTIPGTETVTNYLPTVSPGRVPETLTVSLAPAGLQISWSASCSTNANDYAIYEGQMGAWYSHTALACTDSLHDLTEVVTPSGGNRYYLVAPLSATAEGSYGKNSGGVEIPPGAATCRAQQALSGACP